MPVFPASDENSISDDAPAAPTSLGVSKNNKDETSVDCKSSQENMEDDDIYSSDYYFIEGDEKMAQFSFRS